MNFLRKGLFRRMLSAVLSLFMLGSLVAPQLAAQAYNRSQVGVHHNRYAGGDWDARGQHSEGQEPGRSIGGTLGLAGGMVGGAALAHAVIGAAGIAAWGPLATFLIGSAITVGGAFLGAKLFSNMGGKFTQALGRDNMWMMIGAVIGTVAAIALIPAAGPFAGAAGLIAKGMIGGIAGGVLAKIFAPQLETLATPRNMMLGVGALVGGLGGGIPGAIAGAAGGYVLGAVLDDHFFSQPGDSIRNYLPFQGSNAGIGDSLRGAWDRLTGSAGNASDRVGDFWDRNYHRNQYYDPVYRQSYQYSSGRDFGYDSPYDYGYQTDYRYNGTSYGYNQSGSYQYDYGAYAPSTSDTGAAYKSFISGMQNGDASGYQGYVEAYRNQHQGR